MSLTVTNTGDVAGKEVVQLYLADKASSLARPVKELKGFRKVDLAPGESKVITFKLDYNPQANGWVTEPAEFEVLVGSSSEDVRAVASFILS